MDRISIAGYSFHGALAAGTIDLYGYLESCRYVGTPRLREVATPIIDVRTRPAAHVRRLSRILAAASVRANPMVWLLLNLALPWDLVVCVLLARLKDDLAQRVPDWLSAWYRIEALASLADAAYLNPEYVFPELAASAEPDGRLLCARGLGHPLLPASAKVGNDLDLGGAGRVVVITGANMSGKSTFVKAVGVNAALAMAGGPASARELVLSPVRLFAVIRIADSLTDGISYFYAEVRRELAAGRKATHWMWFVFPQIEGLGTSDTARQGNAINHQMDGQQVLFLDSHVEFAKRTLVFALVFGLVCSIAMPLIGDWQARVVGEHQPVKMAAYEGLFETESNAGLLIFGVMDTKDETIHATGARM